MNQTVIDIGLSINLKAETNAGTLRLKGKVTDMGSHTFRIRCDRNIEDDEIQSGDEIIIKPADKKGILPLKSRFVRLIEPGKSVMVLSLPEGDWLKNRRSFARAQVKLNATILRKGQPKEFARILDISGNGALIETGLALGIGDEFHIAIEMPKKNSPSIGTKAVVRREAKTIYESNRYGIEFTDIGRQDQDRVCRLVLVTQLELRRGESRMPGHSLW